MNALLLAIKPAEVNTKQRPMIVMYSIQNPDTIIIPPQTKIIISSGFSFQTNRRQDIDVDSFVRFVQKSEMKENH